MKRLAVLLAVLVFAVAAQVASADSFVVQDSSGHNTTLSCGGFVGPVGGYGDNFVDLPIGWECSPSNIVNVQVNTAITGPENLFKTANGTNGAAITDPAARYNNLTAGWYTPGWSIILTALGGRHFTNTGGYQWYQQPISIYISGSFPQQPAT